MIFNYQVIAGSLITKKVNKKCSMAFVNVVKSLGIRKVIVLLGETKTIQHFFRIHKTFFSLSAYALNMGTKQAFIPLFSNENKHD